MAPGPRVRFPLIAPSHGQPRYHFGMANENTPIEDTRQPVYDDRQAAANAAQAEAEDANITAVGAVLESAPEGYGLGSGETWPPADQE